ncbi:Tetratricopeptide repeat-containing protein [Mariprofundus ferrinatatus]|uniref:Tetratricopeptide repeat-containing protein n=1 Tax=Mariprofundus ferrinatatus TaxID=1921087 RepID=A0A2K8LA94_9PROT|nr:tetratricopeptide repeat protein [Mariprofundus ferrinatatus]ATX82821.1 Tetratricopeptide repeat-containing protein [Mariprofundus ferrinatatus]
MGYKQPLIIAILSLLLLSCGASGPKKPPEVVNPYTIQAETHTGNGLAAMQKERWDAAERSFSRALAASQLADDSPLIRRSWYNLGTALSGANNLARAEEAYSRAIELSANDHDEPMRLRALLALRLMQQRSGRIPETFAIQQLPQSLFSHLSWPADLHLQAGRIAQRLGDPARARSAYVLVTQLKSSNASSLQLKAGAHMGLALLARDAEDNPTAWQESEQALLLCRKVGAPRLTAHALLLQGELSHDVSEKHNRLERALDIYSALNDPNGEKRAIEQLLLLAEAEGNDEAASLLRLRLQSIKDKLGK